MQLEEEDPIEAYKRVSTEALGKGAGGEQAYLLFRQMRTLIIRAITQANRYEDQ
jgi:hypothetical protein